MIWINERVNKVLLSYEGGFLYEKKHVFQLESAEKCSSLKE